MNPIQAVLAIFLILHGLVHLLWFVVPWNLMEVDGLPYSTTIFAGRLDLGDGGIRIVGLLWILGMIGFVVAGFALLLSASGWFTVALRATIYSFVLCLLGWPDSRFGALIDVAILAVLLVGSQYGLSFLQQITMCI